MVFSCSSESGSASATRCARRIMGLLVVARDRELGRGMMRGIVRGALPDASEFAGTRLTLSAARFHVRRGGRRSWRSRIWIVSPRRAA